MATAPTVPQQDTHHGWPERLAGVTTKYYLYFMTTPLGRLLGLLLNMLNTPVWLPMRASTAGRPRGLSGASGAPTGACFQQL